MAAKKYTDEMTRKEFFEEFKKRVVGATAVVAAGALSEAEAEAQSFKPHNLFTLLKQKAGNPEKPVYEFIGNDGKPVNIGALQGSLKGSMITVSHGFENCEKLCPFVNHGLAELGRRALKKGVPLTSIIIAVMPEVDGATQASRDKYIQTMKEKYKLPQNVLILYATRGGKVSKESAKDAANLSKEMGNIVDMAAPVDHSMAVTLYDSNGNCVGKKIGNTTPKLFADALETQLDSKNIAGGRAK